MKVLKRVQTIWGSKAMLRKYEEVHTGEFWLSYRGIVSLIHVISLHQTPFDNFSHNSPHKVLDTSVN